MLHDEVDAREDLRERTREIVEQVVRDNIMEAMTRSATGEKAFEWLALLVEEKLAAITTEAAVMGYRLASKRSSAS